MSKEIWVNVRVSNLRDRARAFTIRAFVDSGSVDSAMPSRLLRRIGLRPAGVQGYEGWGGRRLRRPWGFAFFEVQGKLCATRVTFEPPSELPTVGAVTLEELGFDLDMQNGTLRPFVRRKRPPRRRATSPIEPE